MADLSKCLFYKQSAGQYCLLQLHNDVDSTEKVTNMQNK